MSVANFLVCIFVFSIIGPLKISIVAQFTFSLEPLPDSDRIQPENIVHNFSIGKDCCIIINVKMREEVHMSEYVFRNVSQIGEKEYQTVIDGQELAEMWKDGIITYNPEIQRGTKVKRGRDNTETEVAVYSKANVKKIYTSMLSGQYFTDMITLNILADGNEKIEFDDNGNLNVDGEINISDGQHRIRALAMILEGNEKGDLAFDLAVWTS
jgi:hypothetical protein